MRGRFPLVACIIILVMASPDLYAGTPADSHRSLSGFVPGTYLGERDRLSLGVRGGLAFCDSEPGFDVAVLPSLYSGSHLFCDVGIGWEMIGERSWFSVFLSPGLYMQDEGTSPLVSGEIGYSLGSQPGFSSTDLKGLMMGLGAGVRIPLEADICLWITGGYRLQKARRGYVVRGPFGNTYSSLEDTRYDIFRTTLGVSFQ